MRAKWMCFPILGITFGLAGLPQTATGQTTTDPATTAAFPCPASLPDASRMQCLQNQDDLLQREVKVANEQKLLDDQTGQSSFSDKARGITIPNVLSIYGFGNQPLTAVLAYSENRSLTVHKGEDVPGGFHVETISSSPAEVVLTRDGQAYVLLMGNGGPSINAAQSQSNGTLSMEASGIPATQGNPNSQGFPGVTGQTQ